MANFKVLLVYPNLTLVSLLPNNIALLSACLKKEGFDVRVFDTTLYRTNESPTNDEMRVERMQVRRFNMKEAGVELKKADVYREFAGLVNEYKPDLIGVSVVDNTLELGINLIRGIDYNRIPVVFGGVSAIVNPEGLISRNEVKMICVGEGEEALVELVKSLRDGLPYDGIKNLWIKKPDSKVIRNGLRKPVDLDALPFEDFSVFEPQRIFRPMQGKMVSMLPINFDRGCPYICSFCDAPLFQSLYRNNGYSYYRVKSLKRIHQEMSYQVARFNISYFYFNSETFLVMPEEKLKEFARMYSEFRLPFWCQTRVETITDAKVRILKEMNCDRISFGLEHGNEEFRKKTLNKHFTNKQVIEAFRILKKYKIKVSVNNIIGFPDETRELVFDTIELNRKIKADSVNGFVFQPYFGTRLRDYCVKKGYLASESAITEDIIGASPLEMPQFSRREIEGLLRTFVLYVRLPKRFYPEIRKAEQLNADGDIALARLRDMFFKDYFK